MKKNNFAKGFTLIELLVVIAIIGILAAIVYAPFATARRKARDAKRVADMKGLVTSLSLYADSNNGYYPKTLSELQTYYPNDIPASMSINTGTTVNTSKYNYVSYVDGDGNAVGYHLFTHLETKNQALDSAAKCHGTGTGTTNCSVNGSVYSGTGALPEPSDSTSQITSSINPLSLDFTARANESDNSCAKYVSSCILDYHQ